MPHQRLSTCSPLCVALNCCVVCLWDVWVWGVWVWGVWVWGVWVWVPLPRCESTGFTARELRESAGLTNEQLRALDYPAAQLRAAGLTASEMLGLQFTAKVLREAGYSAAELKAAGYPLAHLKLAEYPVIELKLEAYYMMPELHAAGFTASELRELVRAKHATTAQMREAGYTATELKACRHTPAPPSCGPASSLPHRALGRSAGAGLRIPSHALFSLTLHMHTHLLPPLSSLQRLRSQEAGFELKRLLCARPPIDPSTRAR